jgi:hypothetical protein
MKTKTVPDALSGGVDQRVKASTQNASDIKNMRVEDQGLGWVNDRGWEPVIMANDAGTETLPTAFSLERAPCRFLDIYSRHNGAEVYYLNERQGELAYTFGNEGTGTSRVILDSNRHEPKANDPGTQLVPHGRFALVCNGYDRPFKFWGRNHSTPFGWNQVPNAPNVHTPNPEYKVDPKTTNTGDIGFVVSQTEDLYGQGADEENDVSIYSYKVSFISDTGSESPLSEAVTVAWTIDNALSVGFWSVMLSNIPKGPEGTKARKIYRTKNSYPNKAEKYYFVKQLGDNVTTDWLDIIKDSLLLVDAPTPNDSIIIPQSFKHGASWNGCVWLGGGDSFGTTVRFSDRFLPEQFDRFRFFEVGSRQGGAITALVPYYNTLIVFRENSIEAISAIADDEYTISTISNDVGTTATNSIVEVPAVGLFFLTSDGVYMMVGGQSGAGLVQLDISHVSAGLHKEWHRLSEGSLARASASYSSKEKEYWVHYPVDGDTENSRGAVYHAQANGWSLRNLTDPKYVIDDDSYGMYFTQISTNPEGWFIMGTYPNYPHTVVADVDYTGFPGHGLQVWSGTNNLGEHLVWLAAGIGENTFTVTPSSKRQEDCNWTSTFNDLGDDSIKKRIISVEIEMVTQGYNDLSLSYVSDYGFSETTAGVSAPMIVEQYKTTNAEPVWTVVSTQGIKNLAVWGEDWSGSQVCRVRWDVHTGLVGSFKWKVSSQHKFHIISHQVEFMDSKQKVITHGGSNV